jgi:hypothetical protein
LSQSALIFAQTHLDTMLIGQREHPLSDFLTEQFPPFFCWLDAKQKAKVFLQNNKQITLVAQIMTL